MQNFTAVMTGASTTAGPHGHAAATSAPAAPGTPAAPCIPAAPIIFWLSYMPYLRHSSGTPLFVQQLIVLNTFFLWLQATDSDKQGL
jgi:hypothetical protein